MVPEHLGRMHSAAETLALLLVAVPFTVLVIVVALAKRREAREAEDLDELDERYKN